MSRKFLRNESFQIKKAHNISSIMDKKDPHRPTSLWNSGKQRKKNPQVYRKTKQVSYKILTIKMTSDFSKSNLEVNIMYKYLSSLTKTVSN